MRITNVEAIPLLRPLKEPFLGGTYQITSRNTLVTRIYTDAGIVGESYGGDEDKYQKDIVSVIENTFKRILIGEDPLDVERLWSRMFSADTDLQNRGIHTIDLINKSIIMQAISAVDIALWDLIGKAFKTPLYKLLGGYRNKVPVVAIGGYYAAEKGDKELIEEMLNYKKLGLAGVKMKVGKLEVQEDARRVRMVRDAVGEDFVIACDANQAWTPDKAIKFCKLVEDLNICWLEEPVQWYDQLRGLKLIRKSSGIPVAAGQGEISRFGCRDLIVNECVDMLNVDATIAGGITEWRKIAAMASMFNVSMAHHEEPQVAIHLLASIPHGLYVEIFPDPSRDPLWFELPSKRPRIKNGCMEVPDSPGLGFDLNEDVIERYRYKGGS